MEELKELMKAATALMQVVAESMRKGEAEEKEGMEEEEKEEEKKPQPQKKPRATRKKKEDEEEKKKKLTPKQSEAKVLDMARLYLRSVQDGRSKIESILHDEFKVSLITDLEHEDRLSFMERLNKDIREKVA